MLLASGDIYASADVEAAAKHIELRHGAEDRLTQRTMHGQTCAISFDRAHQLFEL